MTIPVPADELYVLGTGIAAPGLNAELILLDPELILHPVARKLLEAARRAWRDGATRLDLSAVIARAGGTQEVVDVAEQADAAAGFHPGEFEAAIGRLHAARAARRALAIMGEASRRLSSGEDSAAVLADLRAALDESEASSGDLGIYSGEEIGEALLDLLDRSSNPATRLVLGYHAIDVLLGGLKPSTLIQILGRPGHGKSALLVNLIAEALIRLPADAVVVLFSMEMARAEQALRIVSRISGIPMSQVARRDVEALLGRGRSSDLERIDGDRIFAPGRLVIVDRSTLTPDDIRNVLNTLRARGRTIRLVCVDYLQLISGGRSFGNRENEVAHISRSLRRIAGDFEIPVVSAAQVSRAASERRIALHDCRESGAIEQDSHAVLALEPDSDDPTILELVCLKNRSGRAGWKSRLRFIKSTCTITDLDCEQGMR